MIQRLPEKYCPNCKEKLIVWQCGGNNCYKYRESFYFQPNVDPKKFDKINVKIIEFSDFEFRFDSIKKRINAVGISRILDYRMPYFEADFSNIQAIVQKLKTLIMLT